MSMDWNQIELFNGIDLNDSFVLGWTHEDDQLSFELEASIWPASEYYSKPKDGEYTCYRKAALKFTSVKSINGLKPIELVPSTNDPDGSTDYGNIETLCQTENGFNLSGDFGSVNITGGELQFEVHT
ncbi:Uncharacterised protein [Halioglobus japonicus]|nr:Uncharacterised protein [Halioglobus japonicus]